MSRIPLVVMYERQTADIVEDLRQRRNGLDIGQGR